MADFNTAVAITLDINHEGGYVDNPLDRGGPTNGGITQTDMPGVDLKTLTYAQKAAYYLEHYWKQYYSQIMPQMIANKLFDMGVLFGVGTAIMLLQQVLGVNADGNFGPASLQAVNFSEPVGLLGQYKARLLTHEVGVGDAHPTDVVFEGGWVRRINS